MSNKRRNFLDLSYVDVAEYLKQNDTVLIPIGSCEKHGAHVPLGTDSFITIRMTEMAAERADVLYAPLVPIGYSPHHMGEVDQGTGTLTFSGETYNRILYEIARSLIFHGFSKLIYVSHHGSNTKLIDSYLRRVRYETGAFLAFYKTPTERELSVVGDIIEGPPEETPGWHAGEIETSMIMAYNEALVNMKRAKQDRAHAPRWMGEAFSKKDGTGTVIFQQAENIWVPMEHHEYSDCATIGNPFRGTKAKGEQLFERGAQHLAAFVNEVKKISVKVTHRDFPERAWWS
ncbi:MAG: creatininase family protein [Candidatus Methylomirabilales bacterium]